jgi:hypothetical protein
MWLDKRENMTVPGTYFAPGQQSWIMSVLGGMFVCIFVMKYILSVSWFMCQDQRETVTVPTLPQARKYFCSKAE